MYIYILTFADLGQFLLTLKFTSLKSVFNIRELSPVLHIFLLLIYFIAGVICQLHHELKLHTQSFL